MRINFVSEQKHKNNFKIQKNKTLKSIIKSFEKTSWHLAAIATRVPSEVDSQGSLTEDDLVIPLEQMDRGWCILVYTGVYWQGWERR